jgi:hypothetical protein
VALYPYLDKENERSYWNTGVFAVYAIPSPLHVTRQPSEAFLRFAVGTDGPLDDANGVWQYASLSEKNERIFLCWWRSAQGWSIRAFLGSLKGDGDRQDSLFRCVLEGWFRHSEVHLISACETGNLQLVFSGGEIHLDGFKKIEGSSCIEWATNGNKFEDGNARKMFDEVDIGNTPPPNREGL